MFTARDVAVTSLILAAVVTGQNTDVCKRAIDATLFASKVVAASKNQTVSLSAQTTDSTPAANADLATAYVGMSRNITIAVTAQLNNLAQFFLAPPYAGWGSRVMQTTMGQALYVPAATLGELSFVANTLSRSTNSTTPFPQAASLWYSIMGALTDRLMDQAMNNTDEYSRRSLLLRYTTYTFLQQWPVVPSPDTATLYDTATEAFKEASSLFSAYQFKTFSYPYSNGTANTTLNGFLAAASSEKSPLLLIFGSLYNWKEITFLRYGLGALRRGLAVAVVELPGQTTVTNRPPYMPSFPNYTIIGNEVINVINNSPEWSKIVDTQEVYILGIVSSGFSAALACAGMGSRIKGCIFNPGLYNMQEVAVGTIAKAAFTPLQLLAKSAPQLFPNNDLAKLYSDAGPNIVAPLLLNCTADSGAPQALSTLMSTLPFDPDLMQGITSLVGMPSPPTYENILNQVWPAFRRLATVFPVMDPSTIKAPVLVVGGDQDLVFGGQEQRFFNLLSDSVKRRSKLQLFTNTSGAALGAQIGAGIVLEQELYPWLAGIMGTQ